MVKEDRFSKEQWPDTILFRVVSKCCYCSIECFNNRKKFLHTAQRGMVIKIFDTIPSNVATRKILCRGCNKMFDMSTAFSRILSQNRKGWAKHKHIVQKIRTGSEFNSLPDQPYCLFAKIFSPFQGIGFIRSPIGKHLRQNLWVKYCGNVFFSSCFCCGIATISVFDFQAGHIVSDFHGGEATLENLRPICGKCNRDMGTINMIWWALYYFPSTNKFGYEISFYKDTEGKLSLLGKRQDPPIETPCKKRRRIYK